MDEGDELTFHGTSLEQGAKLYERDCAACHGTHGGGNPAAGFPRIQGQQFNYLTRQFEWSRDGRRRNVNFLDLILLGVLMREALPVEGVVAIAIANPLQTFRTAAFVLFDPRLVLLGASAYAILDLFGRTGYMIWALCYPAFPGTLSAAVGYWVFRRGDLV